MENIRVCCLPNAEAINLIFLTSHKSNIQKLLPLLRLKAQYMMGNLYWNGHGVPVQTDIAQVWWKMAADKGYKDAQFSLPYQYCYIKHPMC